MNPFVNPYSYVLDENGEPKHEPDMHEWGRWLVEREADRRIAHTMVGDVRISTVFLGLDHSFGQCKLSVLWETMVFGGPHDKYCDRYTSRADADDGHKRTVRMVQDSAQ